MLKDFGAEMEGKASYEGLPAATRSRARRSKVKACDLLEESQVDEELDESYSTGTTDDDGEYDPKKPRHKRKKKKKKKKRYFFDASAEIFKSTEVDEETCVVLGRAGGPNVGIYGRVLSAWWERYEAARHNDKRLVCAQVIREMTSKGVKFLSRVDTGLRNGK